ncbi:MAG: AIR synthase-related protein, partial [Gammaproteobacteria bacterium]
PLLEALMEPTRIYVKPLLELIGRVDVHAMAHITGGGIVENLPRVLPDGCEALIDTGTWPRPAVFEWLSETGGIPATELWRTFNCGVGMIIAVTESDVQSAIDTLNEQGESAWRLGDVQTGSRGVVLQ